MTIDANVSSHGYVLVLVDEERAGVCQAALEVDWGPAAECVRLQAIRGGLSIAEVFGATCVVEPIWHERLQAPHVRGLRVQLGDGDLDHACTVELTTAYFAGLAAVVARRAVDEGRLAEDEPYRYLITAFPRQEPAARHREGGAGSMVVAPDVPEGSSLRATSLAPSVHLRNGRLPRPLDGTHGDTGDPGDLPVLLPSRVLEEASDLTLAAGGVETGGILIGHLCQDPSVPEAFVQVTGQIPVRHVEADATRLAFGAEAWTEVRSALALRGDDEVMVGWWHSHPVHEWCKDCPAERQRACPLARGFLSAHDRILHRTVFPRAWSSALVMSRPVSGPPTAALFGWRHGSLARRGYHLLEETATSRRRRRVAAGGGDDDVS